MDNVRLIRAKSTIRRNLVYLTEHLTNVNTVLIHLRENQILAQDEVATVRSKSTCGEQSCALWELLERKDWIKIAEQVKRILAETNNVHCVEKLENWNVATLKTQPFIGSPYGQTAEVLQNTAYEKRQEFELPNDQQKEFVEIADYPSEKCVIIKSTQFGPSSTRALGSSVQPENGLQSHGGPIQQNNINYEDSVVDEKNAYISDVLSPLMHEHDPSMKNPNGIPKNDKIEKPTFSAQDLVNGDHDLHSKNSHCSDKHEIRQGILNKIFDFVKKPCVIICLILIVLSAVCFGIWTAVSSSSPMENKLSVTNSTTPKPIFP